MVPDRGRPSGDDERTGMVDAGELLALTASLRRVRARIEDATVTDSQRGRWQRTLVSIAEDATDDIDLASDRLIRLEEQVVRATR